MLIIGSQALKFRSKHLLDRPCADYDFIATYEEFESFMNRVKMAWPPIKACYPVNDGKKMIVLSQGLPIEFEIAWPDSSAAELIDICENERWARIEVLGEICTAPSLDILFELKSSHRFLKNSPHFLKTMRDRQRMRDAGAKVVHHEWLKRREKETYTYAHPKLNVEKEDFFKGDGVQYVYDHDSIHEAMKHLERPAYTYFKPIDKPVMCDRIMFESASRETQLYSVLEEAYVLALERSQIPFPGVWTPRKSFEYALMKICTSITSGWWRDFAYENYDAALAIYDERYVDKFKAGIVSGVVRKL